jgi:hypothetical protein
MGTKEQERKPVPQASFISEGEYWTLAFEGRFIRLRDSPAFQFRTEDFLRSFVLIFREFRSASVEFIEV